MNTRMKEVRVRDDHQSRDNHKINSLKASQTLSEYKARGFMGAGKMECEAAKVSIRVL